MTGPDAGARALHAAAWTTTEIDGEAGAGTEALRPGVTWAWWGRLWRLDGANGALRLPDAIGRTDLRRVAALRATRLLCRTPVFVAGRTGRAGCGDAADPLLRGTFRVTDGYRDWSIASVSRTGSGGEPPRLAVFDGAVPPPGRALWVVDVAKPGPQGTRPEDAAAPAFPPAACVAPEMAVETPHGPRPATGLRPGDLVLTDAGPAPLRAVRLRPAAPAFALAPEALGPGVPPQAQCLGAASWVGVESAALAALFGDREALVSTRDLADLSGHGHRLRADLIALTLDRHAHGAPLIMAGGLPILAGPSQAAGSRTLSQAEVQIALGQERLQRAPRLVLGRAA